jgi:hypothetical protein
MSYGGGNRGSLNSEGGKASEPYTAKEIDGHATKMPNLPKSGDKYCRKP